MSYHGKRKGILKKSDDEPKFRFKKLGWVLISCWHVNDRKLKNWNFGDLWVDAWHTILFPKFLIFCIILLINFILGPSFSAFILLWMHNFFYWSYFVIDHLALLALRVFHVPTCWHVYNQSFTVIYLIRQKWSISIFQVF